MASAGLILSPKSPPPVPPLWRYFFFHRVYKGRVILVFKHSSFINQKDVERLYSL